MPVGNITRGTTNPNRLRRVDRWISIWPGLRTTSDPLVVDLGFGRSAITTVELRQRLLTVRPDVEVVGLEIDAGRVASAREDLRRWGLENVHPPIRCELGGFEIPLQPGRRPAVIRAFNVLRQYDEADVATAWFSMRAALQPGGLLVEGTCDELGRVATWVALTPAGPASLTISLRLGDLDQPSQAAQRLPKALIHHNVPGERIHKLMLDLDRWWSVHSPLSTFGATQRWRATVESLRTDGWPVLFGPARWRLGEVTIDWVALVRE